MLQDNIVVKKFIFCTHTSGIDGDMADGPRLRHSFAGFVRLPAFLVIFNAKIRDFLWKTIG